MLLKEKMKQYLSINSKKAQAWGVDLLVAVIIFISGLVILYVYAINNSPQSVNQLDEFYYEGNLISNLLLNENELGILSESKINQTKLEKFNNLDYEYKKRLLGVNNDFYIKIDNLEIDGSPKEYFGKMNVTKTDIAIKITRISIYKNKPAKFEVFIWK